MLIKHNCQANIQRINLTHKKPN